MIGKVEKRVLRKFRLGTALVVPFILQIIAVGGLIGFILYRSGQQAVNDVASQLRTELTNRITEKLASYTSIPYAINRLNASALSKGNIDPSNAKGEYELWQQMQIYPTISYISCADEKGGFIGVGRFSEEDRSEVFLKFSNAATGFRRLAFGFDSQGNRTEEIPSLSDKRYDPRVRPWYKEPKAARQEVWSDIYLETTTSWPDITASTPVYNQTDNSFIGVCGSDFYLPLEMSNFLGRMKIGKTGTAFIMERSGRLVATSSQQPMIKGTGKNSERLLASESANSTIRATAEYLKTHFGDLNQIQSVQQLDFKLGKEQQYVQIIPFRDRNLDWLVLVTVPESDFMAQIDASRRNALWLSLGGLGVAMATGILTSRWVTRPILKVSQSANSLAEGNLDLHIKPSFLTELDTLANSFNGMAGQLKESIETLEIKNEELRIAEENYRSIFENALEGIFQSSPEGRYIKVNPALAKIYGYDSPSEMIESITNIGEQLYVDPEKRAEFRELLAQQEAAQNFEYRSYRKDSSIIWVQVDARVVKDSSGQILYYEGLVEDITERKRREVELRRQLEELKIEIDQKKREQEVAMLTESSYFQEVKQEMTDVNLDEFWS